MQVETDGAHPDAVSEAREVLGPCPHCAAPARFGIVEDGGDANPDFGGHFVQCTNDQCFACMGLRFACGDDPRPDLAAAWNTRAATAREQAQAETIAGLREALEPFARDYRLHPDTADYPDEVTERVTVTLGDLRRAARTLTESQS